MTKFDLSSEAMEAAAARLSPHITRTPTIGASHGFLKERFPDTQFFFKYEHLQESGTFKFRGVMNNLLSMPYLPKAGVTAMSAGNHAIAVAVAARKLGLDAKVVMQATANPARISATKAAGAELVIAKDGPSGFAKALEIAESEDRLFIHPFDGMRVAEATAGVSKEMLEDVGGLDTIIVSVGGGGLAGGVAAGAKLIDQAIEVLGVEPEGAAAMTQSFKDGKPATLDNLNTIADSLAPPMTTETTYGLCSDNMDGLVTVTDDQMAAAAYLLFRDFKLAVEPACAAATAAAMTKFKDRLKEKRVGIILCGSNIDAQGHADLMRRGEAAFNKGVLN